MRFLPLLILFGLNTISLQASELRSPKLRDLTCKKIADSSYSLKHENCLKGAIKIADVERISFQDKKYTVLMSLEAFFLGSKFSVTLRRGINFTTDKVVLSDWTALLTEKQLSDFHILVKAQEGDSNTTEIEKPSDLKKLPKTIKSWVGSSTIYYNVSENSEYTFHKVFNDKEMLIGYIAYVWFESEENDIKGYDTQNFDLLGNKAGDEISESWNYHE